MPRPNLGPPEVQVGGYIPYLDLPCERFLGESIGWIIFLSTSGPVLCKYIPWLCCPLPFDLDDPDAISADIPCNSTEARYGAGLFWTMQGISIWGLTVALSSLATCSAQLGVNIATNEEFNAADINPLHGIQANLDQKLSEIASLIQPILDVELNANPAEEVEPENEMKTVKENEILSRNASKRIKRNTGFMGIRIPVLRPLYTGPDEKPDNCERDEIFVPSDGECHELLSQGPCEDTEYVLMNPDTKKGYCAPRLCSPDRVFVFGDQKCHDPLEDGICPPGRRLFSTSFGTPVCGCPYGTYEEDDDDDDDVCQPVLGNIESCPHGEVFWFKSFRREPECLPDPCSGINSKKGINELPYIPSSFDGKCYQLGEELPQCPEDTFYSLSFTKLEGICTTLEDSGFTVLDEDTLEIFASLYGSRLPREDGSSASPRKVPRKPEAAVTSQLKKRFFDTNTNELLDDEEEEGANNSQQNFLSTPKEISQEPQKDLSQNHKTTSFPSSFYFLTYRPDAFSHSFPNFFQSLTKMKSTNHVTDVNNFKSFSRSGRRKRSLLPYASPYTVFQPSLASCRAGSARGIVSKCLNVHMPSSSTIPLRVKRNVPPTQPSPSCQQGQVFNIQRRCVWNRSQAHNSVMAHGLG